MKTNITTAKQTKSALSGNLPVSKKAYLDFMSRIDAILDNDAERATKMKKCLDLYLAGDSSATASLDQALRLAWEFLRMEIDKAIIRSRRARERAKARKENARPHETNVLTGHMDKIEVKDSVVEPLKLHHRGAPRHFGPVY